MDLIDAHILEPKSSNRRHLRPQSISSYPQDRNLFHG